MDRLTWVTILTQVILTCVGLVMPRGYAADTASPEPPVYVGGSVEFKHANNILYMASLPSGKDLLSLSTDGTIRVWDLETRRERERMAAPQYASFWGAQLLKDKNRLLTATGGRGAQIWDISQKKLLRTIYFPTSVYRLTMLPDETRFVTGSSNKRCYVWDVDTGKITRVFTGHTKSVYSVVAPDDKTIISCGADDQVISWNVDNGKINWQKAPASGDLFSLYLSADRTSVLVCSEKKGAGLHNIDTGEAIWNNNDIADVRTASWSHSGDRIALHGNKRVVVVEAATGKSLVSMKKVDGYPWTICWSLDDKKIFASSDGVIQEFDPEKGEQLFPAKSVTVKTSSCPAPFTFPSLNKLYIPDWKKSFELRNQGSWDVLGTLSVPQNYQAVTSCEKAGMIATINQKGNVQLIDAALGKRTRTFNVSRDYATRDIEFSHEGTYLFIATEGRISRVHVPSGKIEQTFPAISMPQAKPPENQGHVVLDVELWPDGGDDLWLNNPMDGYDGEVKNSLPGISQMSISPDDALIAACMDDGTISVISSMDGTVLQSLIYPMKYKGFKSCCFLDTAPLALVANCEKRDIIVPTEPGIRDDDDLGFDDGDAEDHQENTGPVEGDSPVIPEFHEPSWTTGGIALWQFSGSQSPLPDTKTLDSLINSAGAASYKERQAATEALIDTGLPLLKILSDLSTDDPELLTRIRKIRTGILKRSRLNRLQTNLPQMDITYLKPCKGTPAWVMVSKTTPYESLLHCRLEKGVVTIQRRFSDTNLHRGITVDGEHIITGNMNGTFSVFELNNPPIPPADK